MLTLLLIESIYSKVVIEVCVLERGRTEKSISNIIFSLLYKLSDVIFAFLLRSIFIYTLGIEYVGITGLFTNVLTVLSLMELGVGSSIVFSLYKPLSEKDHSTINALMLLYKNIYNVLGIVIAVIGFCLTPFLEYIINLPQKIENINIIYWLTIANTSMSYFFAYKRSLLIADQRTDINMRNSIIFRVSRFFVLSLVLLLSRNFILYLIMDIINTFASNIAINIKSKKIYPYLNSNNARAINKTERNSIIKYMGAGIFSRIGQTVVTSTDNIIISAFVGTIFVGMYSNYYIVIAGLDTLLYMVFSSVTASVGNYSALKSDGEVLSLFKKLNFVNFAIAYSITICMNSLITPFIILWIGNDFVLSKLTVAIICLNFYLTANQNCVSNFMSADGNLFYINRYRALIEAVINLIVSIVLVRIIKLGVVGVFLGTTVCFFAGRVWQDARVLYKYRFKISFKGYMVQWIKRLFLTVFIGLICWIITNLLFHLVGYSWLSWILCAVVSLIVSGLSIIIIYRKTNEYKYIIELITTIIRGLRIKLRRS